MFVGIAFLLTMLVIVGIVYFQYNDLKDNTHQSLKTSLLEKEKE